LEAGAGSLSATAKKGELLVMGSGLSRMDFTIDAEEEIRSADVVFYCLYDSLTKLWINGLRPDAMDLAVLYSERLDRYYTYIQMAEAMLYHVRRGCRVLAIYYGHPGIFAMPAHRAIQIARREGHKAQMRPGISALDYLVADVGFDPAIPGMLNYEATDMLLRQRRLDTSLHVILWQVGVVGEFGYSSQGFKNHGFDLLVNVIEENYGSDWPVINYIASRFPTVEPVIDTHSVGDLRSADVRTRIRSLSTFYIPPKHAMPTDPERSVFLGLTKLGQPVQPPTCAHDNTLYGNLEVEAVRRLADFAVPEHYRAPRATPVADLILLLAEDASLRRRFLSDPEAVLSEGRFAGLTDRAKRLLTIPHTLSMETALAEA